MLLGLLIHTLTVLKGPETKGGCVKLSSSKAKDLLTAKVMSKVLPRLPPHCAKGTSMCSHHWRLELEYETPNKGHIKPHVLLAISRGISKQLRVFSNDKDKVSDPEGVDCTEKVSVCGNEFEEVADEVCGDVKERVRGPDAVSERNWESVALDKDCELLLVMGTVAVSGVV